MSSKKLLSKPCRCSDDSFQWKEFKFEDILEATKIEIRYEAKVCQEHNLQWGLKRKERILETCISNPEEIILNNEALIFFRSIYGTLWRSKININQWKNKLSKFYKNHEIESRTYLFIQKGLIFKETIPARSSLKKKEYITLSEFGREFIKKQIGFLSSDDQILLANEMIRETIDFLKNVKFNPKQEVLYELVNDQLQRIRNADPGWELEGGSLIIPRNSGKNPPKYLLITSGFCCWLKIYRDNLTLREISARAFQNVSFSLDKDPSKVLDMYSKDINSIIRKYSGKNCADLGLVLALDSFTFSGNMILRMHDGNEVEVSGLSVSFSNLSYGNIKNIKIDAKKVLFIENFAVFAQLVLDNWSRSHDTLLIFIKGMGISGHFKKTILKKIVENNPTIKYYVWLDYDLGGCYILKEIIKNLEIDNILIIKIPLGIHIPYRELPPKHIDSIKSLCTSENTELGSFAQFILKNGRVEQEFLLEWYEEILDYNFNKIKN